MASNYTRNYGLCQWAASDKVLRTEFNADNAKIDAALAAKADTSSLSSLSATVGGKASQSALDALSSIVSGHTSTLSKKGNCQLCVKTYVGTGAYGNSTPTTVTFPGKPWFVVFATSEGWWVPAVQGVTVLQHFGASSPSSLTGKWSGNSVSLISQRNAVVQMNEANTTYTVIGLIDAAG